MSQYISSGQNNRFDVRIQELVSNVHNPGGFLRKKNVFNEHCSFADICFFPTFQKTTKQPRVAIFDKSKSESESQWQYIFVFLQLREEIQTTIKDTWKMRRRFDTSHAKTFQNMYSIFIPRVITELRMNITRNGRSQEILLEYLKIGVKWKFAYFMFHPLLLQRPSSYWFTRPPSAGGFL